MTMAALMYGIFACTPIRAPWNSRKRGTNTVPDLYLQSRAGMCLTSCVSKEFMVHSRSSVVRLTFLEKVQMHLCSIARFVSMEALQLLQ